MTTLDVGKELVALCQKGKFAEAIERLYAKDIVSIEAASMPGMPAETKGKEAIKAKTAKWVESNEIHSAEAIGPFPNRDKFAVIFKMDVTEKSKKQRYKMEEVALYTVKNGQIVHEEFYYNIE